MIILTALFLTWGLGKEQVGAPSDKEFLLDYLQLEIFLRQ